jgi:hypothetical protein
MNLNNAVSVSTNEILEEFEDRLNIIMSLIYQSKFDQVIREISRILKQEKIIRHKFPKINGLDWFEALICEAKNYQRNPVNKSQQNISFHDCIFENAIHLARFSRDEKNKNKNNRFIFEEIFSTAVKTSGLEKKVGYLVRLINTLCETNSAKNEDVAKTLSQIKSVSKDFECHSFLSISLTWEVITSGIALLCDYSRNTQATFELNFPKLEQSILEIDNCLDEIYGFIDHELQANYFLRETSFLYRKRYSEKSIFSSELNSISK